MSVIPGNRLSSDPDELLLERIARGDASALSVFVARKMPRLMSLGRRLLGDASEAEDVAQETLLRTWKQARDWVPGKARIDTWMHRVALNLCYDRLRRRRDNVSADDIEIIDSAAGPAALLEQAQTAQRLQTALNSLPERQKVAITLCYYQELSNIEAAAMMEVSIEALESLLARARRGLKGLMQGDNDVTADHAPRTRQKDDHRQDKRTRPSGREV
ncbi:RNA polymerase sigma factor [Asticcacaulis sp. EMRT-3]|nr:RNA polymerase sigma factor [Asticcacaulis sp. EMRT-3]MDI7775362.1 RNA polymerase sigma factor [Asticcacaulis sp. EMRT-3]